MCPLRFPRVSLGELLRMAGIGRELVDRFALGRSLLGISRAPSTDVNGNPGENLRYEGSVWHVRQVRGIVR
jgi:hypothetical protein